LHTDAALKAGARKQEIAEALGVAMAMNAGAALVYSLRAPDSVEAQGQALTFAGRDSGNSCGESDALARLHADRRRLGALAATSQKGTRHGQHKKCQYRYSQNQYDHESTLPNILTMCTGGSNLPRPYFQ
jgi:hypothetical protein